MEQAAILKSGEVVKLTGLINPKYTIYGFLNSFETVINGVTKKFKETVKDDFRDVDLVGQVNKDVIGGFYEEDFFLEYLIDKNKLYQLKNHKYTFKLASAEDEIVVKKIKIAAPYTDFCKIETYKWPYQPNTSILDYGTWQIKIPQGITPIPLEGVNVQLNNTAMQFYNHKIALFVTPLTNADEKREKAFLFAKIAIQINSIENIFNFIELGTATDFGQYINSQKSEWSTQPIFVNPTVEVLEDYMRNLTSFYEGFYANQISIKKAPKKKQFYWLARCLSAEALATVPANDKFDLLYNLSKQNVKLTERNDGESLVLKVIESFTFESVSSSDRNDLLHNLVNFHNYITLRGGNGPHSVESKTTLFEILYKDIDDDRYSRYTFGLWNSYNNRMTFIILLYRIWFSSTYNPTYPDPSYTMQLNTCGVYEESPYMQLKNNAEPNNSIKVPKYFNATTPPFLIYETVSNSENGVKIETTTNFSYKMVGKSIEVYQSKIESRKGFDNHYSDSVLYGTYAFLQPITVIGLKPDLDLVQTLGDMIKGTSIGNQKIHTIPAFLLFYMEDYSDLKKIDFGIMLSAEIALNLTGIGALSDLRYLGYLSKMRSLWTAESVVASDIVLSWKAVSGVVNAVEFTAINALSMNNYIAHTTNDSTTKELAEKMNSYLMWVAIGSMSLRPHIQSNIINSAFELDNVVTKFNKDGISIYRPNMLIEEKKALDDALLIVRQLVDNKAVAINGLIQKLTEYGTDSEQILLSYNQFTTATEKYAFQLDYGLLIDPEIRQLLNLNNAKAVDNWRLFYSKNIIIDRRYVEILTNQNRVDGLIRYYSEASIRKVLEPLSLESRLNFIDKFGRLESPVFEELVKNPNGVILLNEASVPITNTPDFLTSDNVIEFLKEGPTKNQIGVRIETQRLNWTNSMKMYEQNISFQAMSLQELKEFHSNFKNYFHGKKLDTFYQSNRMSIRLHCYNGSELIEPVTFEWYISGTQEKFNSLFENVSDLVKERFIQPSNTQKYNNFSKNAYDFNGSPRVDDTEIKFLYNFFENHYHKGTRFVIEIDSGLYTCTSCQKYLQAAQKFAQTEGKILDIKFIAHPGAKTSGAVFKLLGKY
jgi:hypothetical protein